MKLQIPLFLLLASFFVVLSSGSVAAVDCSLPDADILFPDECDFAVGPAVDCSLPDADILFPDECGSAVDCSLPDADILFPEKCSVLPPPCTLDFWGVGEWSSCSSAGVQTRDVTLIDETACSRDVPGSLVPADTRSCEPPARACIEDDWIIGDWSPSVCPASQIQTRDVILDAVCDSGIPGAVVPEETRSCVHSPPVNNPPVIVSFLVPASAERNSDITLTVSATDSDEGIDRIEILKEDGSVLKSETCSGLFSCTKSFIVRVPDAFDAVYTFFARVFDTFDDSSVASGTGRTNPGPIEPPVVPPLIPVPENVLEPVKVSVPSDELFVSTIVPDTGCVAPGADTFLYISLNNRGRALDDVKVTAIVDDLGIRAVSGPFSVKKGSSASRFLYFNVPEGAGDGDYYVRVSVSSGRDSIVKYRNFEVSSAC